VGRSSQHAVLERIGIIFLEGKEKGMKLIMKHLLEKSKKSSV